MFLKLVETLSDPLSKNSVPASFLGERWEWILQITKGEVVEYCNFQTEHKTMWWQRKPSKLMLQLLWLSTFFSWGFRFCSRVVYFITISQLAPGKIRHNWTSPVKVARNSFQHLNCNGCCGVYSHLKFSKI